MILYHYTTISGLISILTQRELWATDCRYLNDGTEIQYAEDLFFAEIDKLKLPELKDGGYNIAWRGCPHWRMFVTCFCEDGDLLSQWRGYGTDHGYAIGFESETLSAAKIGELVSVQYGISDPLTYFAEELKLAPTGTGHPGVHAYYYAGDLLPRLARVKHPRFSEEREWRLMRQTEDLSMESDNLSLQFRPSSLGPVPYIVNKFSIECLREVVVGPGPYSEVRAQGVTDLLRHYCFNECVGLTECGVRLSEVPLRR